MLRHTIRPVQLLLVRRERLVVERVPARRNTRIIRSAKPSSQFFATLWILRLQDVILVVPEGVMRVRPLVDLLRARWRHLCHVNRLPPRCTREPDRPVLDRLKGCQNQTCGLMWLRAPLIGG